MPLNPGRLRRAAAIVLVASVTFLVYVGSLKNDFIGWDDEFYVLASPYITPLSGHMVWSMFSHFYFKSWTPLTLLSHAVDYRFWGLDPRGHHLTNMLIHSANAVWVLLLSAAFFAARFGRGAAEPSGETGDSRISRAILAGGILSALLFAWHPLRVESVACVSSRKDLLSAFFAFPSLLLYTRYAAPVGSHRRRLRYAGSIVLFALALAAKGSVMMLPALLVIVDLAIGRLPASDRRELWDLCVEKVPYLLLALAAAVVAYDSSEGGSSAAQLLRAKSEFNGWELGAYNIAFYVVKTVWPAKLAALYSYPKLGPFLLLASITPALTILAALLWWRGSRSFMEVWAAYVIALLPMAGFIPSTIQTIANRYVYFAAAPFCMLAGGGIAVLLSKEPGAPQRRFLVPAVAASSVILVVLGFLSVGDIGDWRDAETVWRHTITVSPNHPLAHNELGLALLDRRDFPGAIASFQRAIELHPSYAEAMCNMGGAYVLMGDTAGAERVLRASLALAPGEYQTITNLGNVRLVERRFDEAAALYRQSLAINPSTAVTTYDLGYALLETGKTDEALAALRRAIILNPNYRDAYFLIGEILSTRQEGGAEAIAAFRRAARLGHDGAQRILASRGLDW